MNKIIFLIIALLVLGGAAFFLLNQTTDSQDNSNQKVAATIFPLYDIVQNIAGDEVETVLVVNPGASPHTFDPSPDDIRRIRGSQAVFMIGHGIDDWSSRLADTADIPDQIVVDKNVNLREYPEHEDEDEHEEEDVDEHDEEGIDPHYWLNVVHAKGIAAQVRDELIRLYPEHKEAFEANYNAYDADLNELDTYIRAEIADLENKNIATFHNAWGYFAEEYGINIVATFEEFPGEEPSAAYLRQFTEKVQEHNVTVIFAEPHFSTTSLEPIAQDLGVTISMLGPEGGIEGADSYISLMRYNVNQIISALK